MNPSKPAKAPSSTETTVFVVDNDSNRERRTSRIAALKDLGLKVSPARTLDGALARCLAKNFDLVVVHAGNAAARAAAFCEELLAAKPGQRLLLLQSENTSTERSYLVLDDLDQLRARIQRMLELGMSNSTHQAA